MSITATFTIKETTRYNGRVRIDPALWLEVFGVPLAAGSVIDSAQLREYVNATGSEVEERYGDIEGQAWYGLELAGAAA